MEPNFNETIFVIFHIRKATFCLYLIFSRNVPSFGKNVYDVYRRILIVFASLHTAAELAIIALDLKSLSLDDLTCSIAYSIQHFLGIVKVYIM